MWEEDRMRNDCSWAWVSFWVDKNVLKLFMVMIAYLTILKTIELHTSSG